MTSLAQKALCLQMDLAHTACVARHFLLSNSSQPVVCNLARGNGLVQCTVHRVFSRHPQHFRDLQHECPPHLPRLSSQWFMPPCTSRHAQAAHCTPPRKSLWKSLLSIGILELYSSVSLPRLHPNDTFSTGVCHIILEYCRVTTSIVSRICRRLIPVSSSPITDRKQGRDALKHRWAYNQGAPSHPYHSQPLNQPP